MSEPRGAIPKLIIFIAVLIIGILFAVPSEVDIGVMILQAFGNAIHPLNVAQADQMVSMYIILLRVLGWGLIIADVIGIYLAFRRKEYL